MSNFSLRKHWWVESGWSHLLLQVFIQSLCLFIETFPLIQTLIVLSQNQLIYKISSQYLKRLQIKIRKTKFSQRAITPVKVSQVWRNSNLIWQIHIPNFKLISQKTAEKSLENRSVTDRQTDRQTASKLRSPGKPIQYYWGCMCLGPNRV